MSMLCHDSEKVNTECLILSLLKSTNIQESKLLILHILIHIYKVHDVSTQFQQHFNTMLKICKKISKSQVTTRLMLLCSCKDLEVKPYLGTSKKSKLTKLSSWAHSTKVLTCQTSKQNLILNHYQTSLSLLELDFDATTSYQNVKRIHKKYGSCQHLLSR